MVTFSSYHLKSHCANYQDLSWVQIFIFFYCFKSLLKNSCYTDAWNLMSWCNFYLMICYFHNFSECWQMSSMLMDVSLFGGTKDFIVVILNWYFFIWMSLLAWLYLSFYWDWNWDECFTCLGLKCFFYEDSKIFDNYQVGIWICYFYCFDLY